MNDVIYLHMKEPCVVTLGPGRRFAVWVQGCDRRCPGCTAPDAWDMQAGDPISVSALATEIALSDAEGLTISGGEPFLQAEPLARMIAAVRRRRDMGVIVYTGFTLEELRGRPDAQALLAQTDLLIDGPYIHEKDDGLSLRGSSNQRVIPITRRYLNQLDRYGQPSRPVEVFRHGDVMHSVGVADHLRLNRIAHEVRNYIHSIDTDRKKGE